MTVECDKLDAFLADDLSPDDRLRYEGHLVTCETCRHALNQQQWIDALLSSPDQLELECASPALIGSVHGSIASRRRQTRLMRRGLAAAAVLFCAVGWIAMQYPQATGPAGYQLAETAAGHNEPSPNPSINGMGMAEAPRATFVAGPDVLAVPVASRHPNVTIVRVYPTYQPSLTSQAASDESDADIFNGG
jgi:hypothetical protein